MDWIKSDLDYDKKVYKFYYSLEKEVQESAIESAIQTVNKIVSKYPPPYTLCLSGGVDSQAMLYAWIISKQPFEIFSAIYNFDSNLYDLETLDQFVKTHCAGIKINYYKFDLINFLETEHSHYSKKYRCGSPHFTAYMKFADIINKGTVLYSGNCVHHTAIAKKREMLLSRNNWGMYHFSILSDKSIVPMFFLETRNLALSFKRSPKNDETLVSLYEEKVNNYHFNKFPVIPQKDSYTGFEKIKEWYDDNMGDKVTKLDRIIRTGAQTSKRNFDLLYRNKYENYCASDRYFFFTGKNYEQDA